MNMMSASTRLGSLAKYFCILSLALCLALSPAAAQTFGEISGTVTDPSGAVIAGAQVTITNTSTNVSRQVETNETGSFSVPFLNPGVYNLTAELDGFKTATVSGRIVEVGDVQNVTFVMEIGAVTEVIEVQAGAQMLQTADTSLGTVIDQQRIVDLPINGRNYLNLVKLSTNVTAEMGSGGQANSRQGGQRANQSISIAGQRQMFNRFTLDGVENTDPNFNTFVVRPSVDALQEFKVQTGVYSAQYGKSTSQINVTTRSGGNEFHGTVFEFLRNDKIPGADLEPARGERSLPPQPVRLYRHRPDHQEQAVLHGQLRGLPRARFRLLDGRTVADQAMRSTATSPTRTCRRSTTRIRSRQVPGTSHVYGRSVPEQHDPFGALQAAIRADVRVLSPPNTLRVRSSTLPVPRSTSRGTMGGLWIGISSRLGSTLTRVRARSGSDVTLGATRRLHAGRRL